MPRPLPETASTTLGPLLDLQAQVAELVRIERGKARRKARRRGRQAAYSPSEVPGPKPSELDIARAKRLWREFR